MQNHKKNIENAIDEVFELATLFKLMQLLF